MSNYSGRSLNASGNVEDITLEPEHNRAEEIRRWAGGSTAQELKSDMRRLTTLTGGSGSDNLILIEEMQSFAEKDRSILDGKPFYCKVIGELQWIFVAEDPFTRPMFYLACKECRKKVFDVGSGYRCENCEKQFEDAVPTFNF